MNTYKDELVLYHHGIKGQKWGVRHYRNYDGTLTAAGKVRYNTSAAKRAKAAKSIMSSSSAKSSVISKETKTPKAPKYEQSDIKGLLDSIDQDYKDFKEGKMRAGEVLAKKQKTGEQFIDKYFGKNIDEIPLSALADLDDEIYYTLLDALGYVEIERGRHTNEMVWNLSRRYMDD